MKVKDLMTREPRTCSPDTTLASAAHLMWDGDCGILPVVDDGELVGVVTDRDMYIALATQNARASHLRVGGGRQQDRTSSRRCRRSARTIIPLRTWLRRDNAVTARLRACVSLNEGPWSDDNDSNQERTLPR